MANNTTSAKRNFDATSPGFIYSVAVLVFTVLASMGVSLPKSVDVLGMDVYTSFSTGGVYAIGSILIVSLVFPIYNFVKSGGKWSLKAIFAKNNTWIALGNALASGIALVGLSFPEGTVEGIVAAVKTQDWFVVTSMILTSVVPPLLRFLKDRNAA